MLYVGRLHRGEKGAPAKPAAAQQLACGAPASPFFAASSFRTCSCVAPRCKQAQAERLDGVMAKGMTTDAYPRDNCILVHSW